LVCCLIAGLCVWRDVLGDLVGKRPSLRQASSERLDIALVAFPSLCLCCRLGRVWQWRCRRQPEPDEERQRLVRDGDMTFEPLDLSGKSVQTTAQRPLKSFGSIWRQERREGGFNDEGLGYALARGVVGKLARQVGRQAEGVLGPHCLEVDPVTGVHRCLAGQPRRLGAQHTGPHSLVIRLILAKSELR
jgi:hypothetical protein